MRSMRSVRLCVGACLGWQRSPFYSAHQCVLKEGRKPRAFRGPFRRAAGVTSWLWEIGDIADVVEAWEASI